MKRWIVSLVLLSPLMLTAAEIKQPDTIELRAAGSLKKAMNEIIESYVQQGGEPVHAQYAPSGLLRKRIEQGERVDLYASANMKHPHALKQANKGGSVVMFARNKLCAMAQPELEVTSSSLLDSMLNNKIKLGTSTPKADPAGDYAWKLFAKAETLVPGAQSRLQSKALQLTGGADSAQAPKGRSPYAWVMENKRADIFLTYCTNAVLAQKELPSLQILAIPESLSVGANYGLMVLDNSQDEAADLAMYILSHDGQTILAKYGFDAPLI
ncbi:molybdate ABC transporter substrate-binding protein [Shewanella sp. D64]|uniref:molybdate ABC transporter substrate-binding protein n=1 Tax=unclassified Shewanella TaxID=196818 RepID=UPI0022BA5F6D|nr:MULTISPECIES: molybdate ABC transporter substrate-binding protein [unclassified Shewanella]MEC4725612.1 molybdate ABC transporter substrate-binding protein [Shewanella sp. D64]MEC4739664.1 molybdate ABC transporter substrate-binding protein [Shewanella sp. E94]WBJ94871.1 molybdate ABC transporter substrate-binding protein [Shewanella sp. MTB7]